MKGVKGYHAGLLFGPLVVEFCRARDSQKPRAQCQPLRVGDFIKGVASVALGSVVPSYRPGVTPTDLSSCLPEYAIAAIREALTAFGKQIRGFDMEDAVLTGVETRTSSPVRIRRGEDFQSLNVRGLYPAGEGAGYAGGILSAAIDGIKVAEAVALAIAARR